MISKKAGNQIIRLAFTLLVLLAAGQQAVKAQDDRQQIFGILRLEEQYWNEGSVEKYVSLYAPDDSTRMIFSSGAVYGKDSILAFYKKYWPKEKMGTLKLTHDGLERLSADYYYITGFFEVSYPDRKAVKGRFSGLMKKMRGRWYLYTDHSG